MRTSTFTASMLVSIALATPALAATKAQAPKTEPETGFVRGENPEWQDAHAGDEPMLGHREFHKQMQQEYVDWLAAWADRKEAPEYALAQRAFRQELNARHRGYHRMQWSPALDHDWDSVPSMQEVEWQLFRPRPTLSGTPRYSADKMSPREFRKVHYQRMKESRMMR